jgi:3-phenylpropionate/trans-cinnamate dioxygenase ferredoxin component
MDFMPDALIEQEHRFYQIIRTDDLPNGERLFIEISGQAIVLFNIAGSFFAIADVCSHDNGPLGDGEIEDHQIICPRHGARFDVRDGKVVSLPAVKAISAFPVRIENGFIEIGVRSN